MTAHLDPTGAFIMFAGLYYGAMYGSSTTSILLNTPGETGSIITAIEGNLMARQGRGAAALATAAIGSFVAGTIGTVLLTVLAPLVVKVALKFGPAEYFALMVLAFTTVSGAARRLAAARHDQPVPRAGHRPHRHRQPDRARRASPSASRSCSTASTSPWSRSACSRSARRFYVASRVGPAHGGDHPNQGLALDDARGMGRARGSRGCAARSLGFPFGALPAGGTEIPTFLSYFLEKKLAKKPEEFGKGAIEGVAGPEAANNAAVAGVLVPLLTLGLPTSATAAILLAAFQQYGLQPGPLLFTNPGTSTLVWGLIASLYLGNVMLLLLNLPLVGMWVRLLSIPTPLLYGGILVFATLGVYPYNQSVFDLGLLFLFGVVGYVMRRFDFPVAPAIIGMILGPLAEEHFRRALSITQGDYSVFVTHPISAVLLAIALLIIVAPFLMRLLQRRRPVYRAVSS